MPQYLLTLTKHHEISENTFKLTFEKPPGFHFIAGQYGGFTLINPPETDAGGITRRFSLLSAPDDPMISIATRMQDSAYKRVLKSLPLGSQIKFAGPAGHFILPEDPTVPVVFIAGGIGITPFYSMLRQASLERSRRSFILLYGNRTLNDAAFNAELAALQNEIDLQYHIVLSEPNEAWQGKTGYIDYTLIKQAVLEPSKPIFYVCGSPIMVQTIQETLDELGIPKNHIRIEDFPGYITT